MKKVWALAFVVVAVTAAAGATQAGAALGLGGNPLLPIGPLVGAVTLVPERSLGPVRLGEKRSEVESQLGAGQPSGSAGATYNYRNAKLVVSYSRTNRVREVRGSGGTLLAYGLSLANESLGTDLLTARGWAITQCSPQTRVAGHGSDNGSFSGAIWRNHKLAQLRVSAIGDIGGCLTGFPGRAP
jgi:hypothetical protein